MSKLSDEKKDGTLDKILEEIEQDRDQLKVKAYLLKAELKDEWERTEKKWHHLKGKSKHVEHEAKEASKDTFAALMLLGQELKTSYKRILRSL